jgi:hypothetical protein
MAGTFYITELAEPPMLAGSIIPIAQWPAITTQQITSLSGSSQSSNAFNAGTAAICIHCDAISSFEIGTAPTAVTTANRRPADFIEYIGVPKGKSMKIAALNNT